MGGNFTFLREAFPSLARFGSLAENYRETDPNSALMKLGMIGETIVSMMFKYDRVAEPYENKAIIRINTLQREGLLPKDLVDVLHLLRKARNKAAHEGWGDTETVDQFLPVVHSLAAWFAYTYGPIDLEIPKFNASFIAETEEPDNEEIEKTLTVADEQKATQATPVSKTERIKRSKRGATQRPRTEAETRLLIDEQLRQVGWEADSQNLRYGHGTRPEKGRNIAIAEWPTDSNVGLGGRADYALFVGKKLVGVVEAKPQHTDIPSVLDYQARDYARQIKKEHREYTVGSWDEFHVPFLFATNGRPYIEQFETKSGIWFHDIRDHFNVPRALQGWPSPSGLLEKILDGERRESRRLPRISDDILTSPNGLNLREYQVAAIHAAEEAISEGQKSVLLAMATGTGKTRTVLGMIYGFLRAKSFKRVLFLVDRTALGEQALDAFKDVKLEELMSLDELYDIKGLEDIEIAPETKVHVSTVQSMVKRVFYPDDEKKPSVTDYDLIIVDEAHRGYLLDREMSDEEVLYRDQADFQSAYRSLIDYFDATKIALTATPALHTTQIFGDPVYTYSYREAVMDGFLVDHDAPHRLTTKLSTEGIKFGEGDTLPLFDAQTGEITNSAKLKDEVTFDVEKFNRQVITEEFNRTVLEEIAKELDPDFPQESGKTLIYAVDDAHADMIVAILKDIFAQRGTDPEAIMKITGSVAGGNKKKIQHAIKRFKNERYPSVVVTVDLLTTGIDVPSITSLVFMRRVKSRILFEQMLGRATRLCPEIGKKKFDVFDPVGVYDALEQVSTMKPVAANPNTSFRDLLEGASAAQDEDAQRVVIDQIIAKLRRRGQNMREAAAEQVRDLAGDSIGSIASSLKRMSPSEATQWLLDHAQLFQYLDEHSTGEGRKVVISHQPDELLSHTREFGDAGSPSDYLEEFTRFIRANINEVAALKLICTKPSSLTRDDLKSLKLTLDRAGFTEQQLSSAVSELSNREIVADIISLVRRYALGSPLVSHAERVGRAMEKVKAGHEFTRAEIGWLDRIEKYLGKELVLSVETFDEDVRFRQQGGFNRIDRVFNGELGAVVEEINRYLYEDEGSAA
ncbi:MAG: type I restriction-modification system endonuclease [Actinomycetaceae bacterium]|nr:type I restriction-modification system endonuclease [Actinomycetaceae bacterium]